MRHPTLRIAGLAAMALVASSCGLSLQSLPKIGGVSGPTYSVTATFANVVNLPANAEVRTGAFSVGYVSAIKVQDFKAVVTMRIKKKVQLPTGTTAAIHFDTPLGEDFVLLQPPQPAPAGAVLLANGSHIPESATQTAPSVEDAFGALGALLNGGGIDQLQTIITQTNLALGGQEQNQKLRSLLESLNATVTSFSQNSPSIDNALRAIAALSKTLNAGSNTISNGIATIGPAVGVLGQENQDLDNMLTQLDNLSSAANNIIEASATGTVATVKALQPLLGQLISVQQQLGPSLTAVDAFERNTPGITPNGYLQLALNATVDLPPIPGDSSKVNKVTVDPPEETQSYDRSAIAILIEGGLP